MNSNRVHVTGFVPVKSEDTPTHEVEVGEIQVADDMVVVCHVIRRRGLPGDGGNFLVAKITDSAGKVLWTIPAEKKALGLGILAEAEGQPVVALVQKEYDGGRVLEVWPLAELLADSLGTIKLGRRVALKREVGFSLDRPGNFSETERKVLDTLRAREEEARRSEQSERDKARDELTKSLLARPTISVGTRYGLPVTEAEWPLLPAGTFVVLVESFDQKTGKASRPLETFIIERKKGGPIKVRRQVVPVEPPTGPKPFRKVAVEFDGDFAEVAVFCSVEQIEVARLEFGLNGGALVASALEAKGETYTVYAVHSNRLEVVGEFLAL